MSANARSTSPAGLALLIRLLAILGTRERLKLLGAWALAVASAALELAGMGLVFAYVYALGNPGHPSGRFASLWLALPPLSSAKAALGLGAAVLGFYVAKNALLAAAEAVLLRVLAALGSGFAELMFWDYLRQPYEEHVRRGADQLRRGVTTRPTAIFHEYLVAAMRAACDAVVIAAIGMALLIVSWQLTIISAALFGLVALVYTRTTRQAAMRLGQQRQQALGEMNRWLSQGLGGYAELRVLERAPTFVSRFRRALVTRATLARRLRLLELWPRMLNETTLVFGVLSAVTLVVLSGHTLAQALPSLALFAAGGMRCITAVSRLMGSLHTMRVHHGTAAEAQQEFVRFHGDTATLAAALAAARGERRPRGNAVMRERLELESVSFTYGGAAEHEERGERSAAGSASPARPPTITEVSLQIERGSFVALAGPSGGGKSTLVRLMAGLLVPASGRILVDGRDIRADLAGWQQQLALIPQVPYLAPESVRDNVAFGIPREEIDDARVWDAIERARLADFVKALPCGLDANLCEAAAAVSGGERQRVALARAIYDDRPFLILDEATAALDNDTERAVLESVASLRGEKTILCVAHRLSTVRRCDCIYFIAGGRRVGAGDFMSLVGSCDPFKRMVEAGRF